MVHSRSKPKDLWTLERSSRKSRSRAVYRGATSSQFIADLVIFDVKISETSEFTIFAVIFKCFSS